MYMYVNNNLYFLGNFFVQNKCSTVLIYVLLGVRVLQTNLISLGYNFLGKQFNLLGI